MITCKVAVGVGYRFAIVDSRKVKHISLKWTGELVSVDKDVYPLYKGETFEESTKVDAVLNSGKYTELNIREHLTR